MISNQILQSTIDGLKNITRKDLSVFEKEGKVIATTEENMIGRQIDAIENFVGSQADSQLILGYQYFKVYDNGIPEYVIQVKGEDEDGYRIGKIAAFQIQSLLVAYKERYDKDNFIKNLRAEFTDKSCRQNVPACRHQRRYNYACPGSYKSSVKCRRNRYRDTCTDKSYKNTVNDRLPKCGKHSFPCQKRR